MSPEPVIKNPVPINERRVQLRRKVEDLAYVSCGSDNGGILLDVSEEGLSFQGIAALIEGAILDVKFILPGMAGPIEAKGQVVWATGSRRCGGVRFVELSEGARQQLRQWISASPSSLNRHTQNLPDPAASVAVVARTNSEPARLDGPFGIPVPASPESMPDAVQVAKPVVADGLRRIHSVTPALSEPRLESLPVEPFISPSPVPWAPLSAAPPTQTVLPPYRYLLLAAVGALILIAGVIGFRARSNTTANSAPFSQRTQAAGSFQVEVLDLRNRRLVLSIDSSSPTTASDAPKASRSFSSVGATVPAETGSASAARRGVQDFALKTPSRLNRPAGAAVVQEPAIAGVVPPVNSFGTPIVINESPNQPLPPQAPAAILPKSGLQQAVLIKRVEPVYSAVARQARAAGMVQVRATIGTDGVPRALRFVTGDARLAAPAIEAIRLWRYRPALLDGQAIETDILVQVEFQLPR